MDRKRPTKLRPGVDVNGHRRLTMRWECPPRMSIRSFAMRELDGVDEEQLAVNVQQFADPMSRSTPVGWMECKQREAIRLSLVAVNDERVNLDAAIPYDGMRAWSARTMLFVNQCFNQLNGLEAEESDSFRMAGKPVDEANPFPAATMETAKTSEESAAS